MNGKFYYSAFVGYIKNLQEKGNLTHVKFSENDWKEEMYVSMVGKRLNFFIPCETEDGIAVFRVPVDELKFGSYRIEHPTIRRCVSKEGATIEEDNFIYYSLPILDLECSDGNLCIKIAEHFNCEKPHVLVETEEEINYQLKL